MKLEIDMSDNSFKSSDFDIEVAKRDVLSGILRNITGAYKVQKEEKL